MNTPAAPANPPVMVQVSDGSGQWWSGPYESRLLSGVLADMEGYGWEILDIDSPA